MGGMPDCSSLYTVRKPFLKSEKSRLKGKAAMRKRNSSSAFGFMKFFFKIRDIIRPRRKILKEAGISPGFVILDFGCGPGGYIEVAAQLTGPSGRIYALDKNLLALREAKTIAERNGLKNIETIESDCGTGLHDNTVDAILLYDTFHHLASPEIILRELHRVLKPEGILSFNDHHMKEREIIAGVTGSGLFEFSKKGKYTYRFSKAE